MAKSRGYRVLQARPAESELRLSFAAIADLVGGAFEETRAKLPLPQERALATALLHVDTEEPAEPRTTATALVSILTMLAAERPVLPDGSELGLRSHLLEVDPLNQHLVYEMRAERWRDGVLEEAETHRLDHALYFRNELLLMFERAGFADAGSTASTRSGSRRPTTTSSSSSPGRPELRSGAAPRGAPTSARRRASCSR